MYAYMMSDLKQRIVERLKAVGLTANAASLQATGNISTIPNILNDRSKNPRLDTLEKVAKVLRCRVEWLATGDGSPEALVDAPADDKEAPRTKGQRVLYVPSDEIVLPGRSVLLPVYSGAAAGSGKIIIGPDIVDRVAMPAALKDVKDAYGILVDGESMVPAYEPGDVAWVHPHLRPMRGKTHILYHTPPLGEDTEAIIKRLDGWNDREWNLWQWNPPKAFTESRKIWPICHRVVGKYEAT
jgi:phage repressor protein C with HTH and peptisase S24 domain